MLVFAHRGASGAAPENTMAAFDLALRSGADGIEFDIQSTADGEVVVLHDSCVDRTSDGHGIAAAMTLEALRALDFGSWFDAAFHSERIPLLREVTDFAARSGLWMDIEIKGFPVPAPGLAEAVAKVVVHCDPTRTILSSFDIGVMDILAGLLPDVPRALLVDVLDEDAWRLLDRKDSRGDPFFRCLHPKYSSVDGQSVRRAHAASLRIHPWTLDEPEPLARMIALGVDGVITGYPERVPRP